MRTRTIAVTTHGRYLVEPPENGPPVLLIVGFHGYAEDADIQLERLRRIPGSERMVLVSAQGLHRFYRGRTQEVGASWMTRQDRDLAIADNINYAAGVVSQVAGEWPTASAVVFAGFSQGVPMAFRAACWSPRPVGGVIALGGDVPPDLPPASLARVHMAVIGRGSSDPWYSQEAFDADVNRLRAAGVDARPFPFEGAHEWTPAFAAAAGEFLKSLPG